VRIVTANGEEVPTFAGEDLRREFGRALGAVIAKFVAGQYTQVIGDCERPSELRR